jgi:hypothetical protein
MIPQKLKKKKKLGGLTAAKDGATLTLYNTGSSTLYDIKKQKDQLQSSVT